jgi:hypothetical protein
MSTRHAVALCVVLSSLGARAEAPAAAPPPAAAVRANPDGSLTLEDATLGFKLVLPKGAKEHPDAEQGNMVYVFSLGSSTVAIHRMRGKIAREFTDADAAKVKAKLPTGWQLVPMEWRGLKLMVLRAEQSTAQGPFLDYGAQIPLQRLAIQLHVAGPQASDETLKKTLADLLLVLNGEPVK